MNLNIEENIFYLNEKIKLLTSAYNYELETSIFTKQLTKELDFIIYTINKIENKINFKIQNSITYKNLRLCLKTRISIKQFLELAIKIDNNIKIDHQFITDQLLSQAQSIQFLIQNIQLFSNESNSDIFISNEEMNMLFQ